MILPKKNVDGKMSETKEVITKVTTPTPSILDMESMLTSMGIDLSSMSAKNKKEIERLSESIKDPMNMSPDHVKYYG